MVIVNKSCVKDMNGTKLTFYAMSFSALFFTIKGFLTDGHIEPFPDVMSVVDLVCLAIVPTAISGITMTYSVKYVGSTATAVMGAMEPVTAVLVGLIAFSEQFTLSLATGIFLIIGAVTLIILTDRN
jgi:drug/metabolite transporter (DMT)-like permease